MQNTPNLNVSDLNANGDPEFMTSLARGLTIIRCFAAEERPMTIAHASRLSGLSRSAVKRCLHTLVVLGYAAQDGTHYSLRPRTLALGYAYLSSSTLAMRAQPLLDDLRDELHESCSMSVMEEDAIYYVARAEVSRIMSVALRVGSRLPLYCTSMGRVLLAAQDREQQIAYLQRTKLEARTAHTCTRPAELLDILEKTAEDGYAMVDQELELGLRSIAVPVINRGQTVAALNIGAPTNRVTKAEMRTKFLPALRRMAQMLGPMI